MSNKRVPLPLIKIGNSINAEGFDGDGNQAPTPRPARHLVADFAGRGRPAISKGLICILSFYLDRCPGSKWRVGGGRPLFSFVMVRGLVTFIIQTVCNSLHVYSLLDDTSSLVRRVCSGPEKVLLYDPDPGARLLIYCR